MRLSAGVFRLFFAAFFVFFFIITPYIYAQEGISDQEEVVSDNRETASIFAQEREMFLGESTATSPANPASAWNIFRILLTLAVVAAAIYGLVFLIKRVSKGNIEKDPYLKILASIRLGVNRSAYVLSVGSQAWLVGSAENGVNLIAEIGDKEMLDTMLLEESKRSAAGSKGSFVDFRALLGKFGVKVDAGTPGPENIRQRSERLKGL